MKTGPTLQCGPGLHYSVDLRIVKIWKIGTVLNISGCKLRIYICKVCRRVRTSWSRKMDPWPTSNSVWLTVTPSVCSSEGPVFSMSIRTLLFSSSPSLISTSPCQRHHRHFVPKLDSRLQETSTPRPGEQQPTNSTWSWARFDSWRVSGRSEEHRLYWLNVHLLEHLRSPARNASMARLSCIIRCTCEWSLGQFYEAIAVPFVTRCRCRCRCGHRFYIAIHQVSLLSHAACAIAIAGFGSSW